MAINEVQGQRLATIEQLAAVQRELLDDRRSLRPEDRNRLAGQQAELEQKLISLEAQLAIQNEKQLQLDVKSPIDGEVVTWDLHNRLPNDRPVQRGQVLLRVADPAGDWQLEVHMPENHMGHVTSYQQTLYEQAREKLRGLLREDTRAKLGEAATPGRRRSRRSRRNWPKYTTRACATSWPRSSSSGFAPASSRSSRT